MIIEKTVSLYEDIQKKKRWAVIKYYEKKITELRKEKHSLNHAKPISQTDGE